MDKIENIKIENLLLDKKNPRIHIDIPKEISQVNLCKYIYDNFGIIDLKDSLKKNGYFQVEPMVVIPSEDEDGKFIVVEGNRRLTAIKILCFEEYRNNAVSTIRRDEYTADFDLIKKLKEIPVVKAKNRDSVNAYLGVRHLNGVIKWGPLAQSKYVYNQILNNRNGSNIAEAISKFVENTSNTKTEVTNHFYKYCIFQSMDKIIKEKKLDSTLERKFSLLEVAFGKTGRTPIAKYIGIESYNRLDPENYEDIISDDYQRNLTNLIKWVFTKEAPIQESRQINQYLKPILSKEESTKAFEQGEDKESALLLSDSYDDLIKKSCQNIHKALSHIQQNWSKTNPDSRQELLELYKLNVVEKIKKTNKDVDLSE